MAKIPSKKFSNTKKKISSGKFPKSQSKSSSNKLSTATAKIASRKLSKKSVAKTKEQVTPVLLDRPTSEASRQARLEKLKGELKMKPASDFPSP